MRVRQSAQLYLGAVRNFNTTLTDPGSPRQPRYRSVSTSSAKADDDWRRLG
jgi:hypothetical protein